MKTFLGILSVFTLICFQTTTATDKPAETTHRGTNRRN